ncbi:hypothetical protein B0H17DRAFT_1327038 [Mycena rosella]|uniref:PH domain-containing protein n=1 Tax=Mycena rosella TaxID=1033263 RepID=A0AAD7E004_MYCRO|nr:hypothetical protein B0H17DRAFT_1327038 [Mycena rosella]
MLGPRLQHHKLISRFESLSDHKPVAGPAISPAKASLCSPKQPLDKKKDKSPIRQSFHNLLAVFNKSSGLRVGRSKREDGINSLPTSPSNPTPDDLFTVFTASLSRTHLASSMFYLTRSPHTPPAPPSVHPVWSFCSASLEDDTMHLTWPTTPSTHSILLKRCTDVRSLMASQLDPDERALLPGDVTDLKVFEILFDGRAPERFATTSVRERARWVSAIWDVILLPSADRHSTQPESTKVSEAATDKSNYARPSTICSSSLDRALPPVPEFDSPIALLRASSPRMLVSPSIYSPTRPESRASSRSRSPSIANLDNLSVVKQRLAQIERNQSTHSAPTYPTPSSRNSPFIRTRSLRVQTLTHDDVPGPVSPTSILESYGQPCSSGVSPTIDDIQDTHGKRNHPSLSHHGHEISNTQTPSAEALLSLDLLTDIHHMLSSVAQRNSDTEATLNIIQNKLSPSTKSDSDFAAITQALGEIDARLRSDLPNIMKLLAEIDKLKGAEKSAVEAPASCGSDKLDGILDVLKVQALQQTDSVRYLNELNSWLEAFVSGGAIHQFIMDGRARDQNAAALQLSVNNLAALITSESRHGSATQSLTSLIDQQRQEQEGLLRALTAELSNEIRGERLRFVDAMKEATAINVQMHVEQLKTELAREVRADLFALYSKQKLQVVPQLQRPMYAPQSRMTPPRALPNRYAAYP